MFVQFGQNLIDGLIAVIEVVHCRYEVSAPRTTAVRRRSVGLGVRVMVHLSNRTPLTLSQSTPVSLPRRDSTQSRCVFVRV